MRITSRTRIEFRFTTSLAACGYGSREEREAAIQILLRSQPDAVGTITTLPGRIEHVLRRASLWGSGTHRVYDLRVKGEEVLLSDLATSESLSLLSYAREVSWGVAWERASPSLIRRFGR